jgi:two-component system, NarL family, nitrate/nitrite response regulator NarL
MATDRPADWIARVIVVDPQPMYRAGLTEAIQERSNLEVVSQAADGSSAIEQIARHAPDVAVIDLSVPGFDGVRALERLIQDESQTRVLILSDYNDGWTLYQAVEAGAAGCLLKDADADTICSAITAVAQGDTVFAPELAAMMAEQIRSRHGRDVDALTKRECEILRLTADGLSAVHVGQELALSQSTVKTHLTHIYAKLGVTSAAAAVCEAMRLNILS